MVTKKRVVAFIMVILMLTLEVLTMFSCGKQVENVNFSFKVDGEKISTITASGTDPIKVPDDPEKKGYEFDGWYWDEGKWEKPFTANSLNSFKSLPMIERLQNS